MPQLDPAEAVILFRADDSNRDELEIARKHMKVELDRSGCQAILVVGRYSVLPFYDMLVEDLLGRGCRLINTALQHRWIANFDYYETLKDLTPESWSEEEFPEAPDGQFVLKGRTNSFKHQWSESMFAANKREAARKAESLRERRLVSQQGLLFRRFVPLENFGNAIGGLPISNEWRCFFVGERLIGYGFYWTALSHSRVPRLDSEGLEFALKCARRVSGQVVFFVVDIARTLDGRWILIELNDGQTSGLSMIDADGFYRELSAVCAELVGAG